MEENYGIFLLWNQLSELMWMVANWGLLTQTKQLIQFKNEQISNDKTNGRQSYFIWQNETLMSNMVDTKINMTEYPFKHRDTGKTN